MSMHTRSRKSGGNKEQKVDKPMSPCETLKNILLSMHEIRETTNRKAEEVQESRRMLVQKNKTLQELPYLLDANLYTEEMWKLVSESGRNRIVEKTKERDLLPFQLEWKNATEEKKWNAWTELEKRNYLFISWPWFGACKNPTFLGREKPKVADWKPWHLKWYEMFRTMETTKYKHDKAKEEWEKLTSEEAKLSVWNDTSPPALLVSLSPSIVFFMADQHQLYDFHIKWEQSHWKTLSDEQKGERYLQMRGCHDSLLSHKAYQPWHVNWESRAWKKWSPAEREDKWIEFHISCRFQRVSPYHEDWELETWDAFSEEQKRMRCARLGSFLVHEAHFVWVNKERIKWDKLSVHERTAHVQSERWSREPAHLSFETDWKNQIDEKAMWDKMSNREKSAHVFKLRAEAWRPEPEYVVSWRCDGKRLWDSWTPEAKTATVNSRDLVEGWSWSWEVDWKLEMADRQEWASLNEQGKNAKLMSTAEKGRRFTRDFHNQWVDQAHEEWQKLTVAQKDAKVSGAEWLWRQHWYWETEWRKQWEKRTKTMLDKDKEEEEEEKKAPPLKSDRFLGRTPRDKRVLDRMEKREQQVSEVVVEKEEESKMDPSTKTAKTVKTATPTQASRKSKRRRVTT